MATYSQAGAHDFFARQVKQGRLAHAYLLSGEDIPSKQAVVQTLLQTYYCPQEQEGQACRTCSVCQRIADNQHPDIYYLRAQGQTIRVDQIRELKDWLGQSPLEGKGKFAIIEQAQRMNTAAANALLTVLEEPFDEVYLLLLAPMAKGLLPTIVSRLQELHIQAPGRSEQVEHWEGQGVLVSHAQLLQTFREETALRWLSDYDPNRFEQMLKPWNQWYRQLVDRDPLAFVSLQTRLKGDLTQQGGLDLVDYALRLTHQLLTRAADFSFQASYLEELVQKGRPDAPLLLALHQGLLEAKQRMLANVSPQLALEQLVIRLQLTN